MNKDTEIKSIKESQRELADRLEALETVETPERKPQAGDVWTYFHQLYIINRALHGVNLNTGITTALPYGSDLQDCTYLGKAEDVLILRSDVEKDDLRQELLDWRDSEGLAMSHVDSCDNEVAGHMFELLKD